MTKNISILFFSIAMLLCSCAKNTQNKVSQVSPQKINKEIKRDALDFPPHYSLPLKLDSVGEDFN